VQRFGNRIAVLHDNAEVGSIDVRAIEATESFDSGIDEAIDRGLIGNIDRVRECLGPLADNFSGYGLRSRQVDVRRAHSCAFAHEASNGGSPDSGA
jgi:hypothetical protein